MKIIPTIFKRDLSLKCTPVTDEINPECQWVFDGEGIATRKIDGVNILIKENVPYIRIKPTAANYTEAQYEEFHINMNKYVNAALNKAMLKISGGVQVSGEFWISGIYEAYGEGIRGNAEKVEGYHMVRISPVDMALSLQGIPRTYRGLMGYFATHDIEGIVFHHRDGRMAKVKTKDFYHLSRP